MTLKTDNRLEIALISTSEPIAQTSWPTKDGHYAVDIKVHNDQIYISSMNQILRYSLDGTFIDVFATDLSSPCLSIAFDNTGNLWGTTEDGDVLRFGSDGTIARTYTGLASGDILGLALDEAYIYLSNQNAAKVIKFQNTNGSLVAEVDSAEGVNFDMPCRLAFGPDGNLCTPDFGNSHIVVLSASLNVLRTINIEDASELQPMPFAQTFGPDGCLYVHDRSNGFIKKIAQDDSIIVKVPLNIEFVNGLTFDDSGNLYAAYNDGATRQVNVYRWSY